MRIVSHGWPCVHAPPRRIVPLSADSVARHLESAAQLDDLLSRFAGEGGVDCGLSVGGDRTKPLGPYDATLQVMQSGSQRHKILRVGISGLPEGHPVISERVLDESMVQR